MIKLIIFDLDGVLVEGKKIHYNTLNQSLKEIDEKYVITEAEHLSIYDGLKTTQKLELLTQNKGLHPELYDDVWYRKQYLTIEAISQLQPDLQKIELFKELRDRGYKLACASNSIRRSVLVMLAKIGIIEYMDLIISNEDVKNSKPHPEMYWKTMSMMECLPEETLIIEDSPYGLLAASRSRANVLRVDNPSDLTLEKIEKKLNDNRVMGIPKWQGGNMNILIPMA
jgi:HAD superfamily hydrolase (TIGR01509 family)